MNVRKGRIWLSALTKDVKDNRVLAFAQDSIMKSALTASATHRAAAAQICANTSVMVTRATGDGDNKSPLLS